MGTKFVVNMTTDGVSMVESNKILNALSEKVVEVGGQMDMTTLVIDGITQDQANDLTMQVVMMVSEIEGAFISGGLEIING
jgi:hypothetical protein